ncbi:hypothetical protein ABZ832_06735 [Streptantibioticus parmotrematis]|uniref:hypothetical protein n=1 Tax=Streptantibioticus parmotrematis TaxID=2873249 RepID=UPI0033EBDC77
MAAVLGDPRGGLGFGRHAFVAGDPDEQGQRLGLGEDVELVGGVDREPGLAHTGHALDRGDHDGPRAAAVMRARRRREQAGEFLPAPGERREIGGQLAEHPGRTAGLRQPVRCEAGRAPQADRGLVRTQRADDRHHQVHVEAATPRLEHVHDRERRHDTRRPRHRAGLLGQRSVGRHPRPGPQLAQ